MDRKNIEDVFTPRRSEVNELMYVHRPRHESSLLRALKRHSHTLIFGQSGSGKSWLYKKVLEDNAIPYVIANCANASRLGSITKEICNSLIEPGTVSKLGFDEGKAAEISAYFAKGGLTHTGKFEIAQDEHLLKAFKLFHTAKPEKKILVLDNLESIFENVNLMNELADIVILLDDTRYSDCNINMLIVGTPNGVLQYFRESKNSESVSNRIQETPLVGNLLLEQVSEIAQKGFEQLNINLTLEQLREIGDHVFHVTLGIAQRIHEYCEQLAYCIKDNNWIYESKLLLKANNNWLTEGLRQCYQVIEGHLNSRDTTVARRNQVIYSITKIETHQFDSSDIDQIIRKEFPTTVPATNMGIGSILSELSEGTTPLLIKNEKVNAYSIKDPRYLMCARIVLYKNDDSTKVIRRQFYN